MRGVPPPSELGRETAHMEQTNVKRSFATEAVWKNSGTEIFKSPEYKHSKEQARIGEFFVNQVRIFFLALRLSVKRVVPQTSARFGFKFNFRLTVSMQMNFCLW